MPPSPAEPPPRRPTRTRAPLAWQSALLPLLGSAGLLAGAFAFQFLGGLAPCELCLWQRWAHAATIVLALATLAAGAGARRPLLVLTALTLVAGAAIAGFHVGVEQHWWAGTAACTGGALTPGASLEQLRQQLLSQPVVRCDQVPWSMLGLSMAAWNGLISLALAAATLAVALRTPDWPRRPA